MSELERWLRRRAAREQHVVLLEEGLLGDRLPAYSFYRLRYFFLRYLIESATHALTVVFLFRGVSWGNFLLVATVVSAGSLVSSFWWGALEALRSRVRDLQRSGQGFRAPRVVGGWLLLAVLLGTTLLAGALGWTVWRAAEGRLGAVEAFVGAALLRVALDLPTRCYHSGVYALRRVYKPLWATLLPDVVGFTLILALWWAIGIWALVASSLLLSVLEAVLTVAFTRRTYHFLGLAPQREATWENLRGALRGAGREALAGGASYAVTALDALVVLALVYGSKRESTALLVLFIAQPTIRAGFDWARILYFDLKRLELRLFTNLRRRFERHTAQLAWILGVVFWAVATGIASGFYGHRVGPLAGVLLAFFVARALLARAQLQTFAAGSYGALLGVGAVSLVALAAVGPLVNGENGRLAAVAAVAAAGAVALARLGGAARARGEPGTALLTLEWLRRLGEVREPVLVGSARIVRAAGPERLDARTREARERWRLGQLAGRTARRLGPAGSAAWIGPDRVVWFEPDSPEPRVTADWLERASGGLVAGVAQHRCPAGEEALLAAGRDGLLGDASPHLLTAIVPVGVDAARRTYEELVPRGLVYAPDEPTPAALAELPGPELRAVLRDALSFARDLRVARRTSSFDVTALCAAGELRLVFVTPLGLQKKVRTRWRRQVTTLDVRAAIGGERAHQPRTSLLRIALLRA